MGIFDKIFGIAEQTENSFDPGSADLTHLNEDSRINDYKYSMEAFDSLPTNQQELLHNYLERYGLNEFMYDEPNVPEDLVAFKQLLELGFLKKVEGLPNMSFKVNPRFIESYYKAQNSSGI